MTLASAAFGFGQPLRPNLMFLVGVLALGRVLWWIRTLHIEIRRPRDNFLHAGFLSPPVSDRASLIERSSPTNLTLTTPQDTVLICALAPRASYTGLILARSSVRLSSRQPDTSSPTPCGHTEGTTHQLTHPPQTRNWPSHPPLTVPHLAPTSDSRTSSPSYPSDSGEALAGHVPVGAHRLKLRKALVAPPLEDCGLDRRPGWIL